MSAQTFNPERLMQVILAPQVSEKATYIAEKHNHVIFRVDAGCNQVRDQSCCRVNVESPEHRGRKVCR